MMNEGRMLTARTRDALFVLQIIGTVVWLLILTAVVVLAAYRISEINQRQIELVQTQNEAQLCSQYQITLSVKSIARSLGLPTNGIVFPDVEDLDCAS